MGRCTRDSHYRNLLIDLPYPTPLSKLSINMSSLTYKLSIPFLSHVKIQSYLCHVFLLEVRSFVFHVAYEFNLFPLYTSDVLRSIETMLNIFGPRRPRTMTEQLTQRYLEGVAALMSQTTFLEQQQQLSPPSVAFSERRSITPASGSPSSTMLCGGSGGTTSSTFSTLAPRPFSPVVLTQLLNHLVK